MKLAVLVLIGLIAIAILYFYANESFASNREKAKKFAEWARTGKRTFINFRDITGGDIVDYHDVMKAGRLT